jgi:hypothetical protein
MLAYSPELRDQAWVRYRIKDGEKGPMVWEVKHVQITVKDERDLPGMRLHLIVARNVLDPTEIKFFVSNAPAETSVQTLLLVAFSRWRVERCFEDQKQEVGLDQWEGRHWLGLKRHLILTSVSYLFLAGVRAKFRGEKPDLTICQVHTAVGALVRSWWLCGRASALPIEDTARCLGHWQQRIAAARKCHVKRTRKKLRQMGIYLKDILRCKWP